MYEPKIYKHFFLVVFDNKYRKKLIGATTEYSSARSMAYRAIRGDTEERRNVCIYRVLYDKLHCGGISMLRLINQNGSIVEHYPQDNVK